MTEMQIAYRNLQETRRHNRATEQVESDKAAEIKRSNLVKEAETYRSNLANEAIKRDSNVINASYYGAQVSENVRSHKANEAIATQQALETKRSNIAKESETQRHNQNVEQETMRSNIVNESQANSRLNFDNKLKQEQLTSAKIENKYKEANIISGLVKSAAQTAESGINSVTNILRAAGNVINMVK